MQQPCSPPSYVSSFTNNSTINNTNASLNRNLFNTGNTTYQTPESNNKQKSNGSNMTNQSDLNNHISAIKNDKLINEKQTDKASTSANSLPSNNSSNNLTPKPPKKRYLDYLENGEFKEPGKISLLLLRIKNFHCIFISFKVTQATTISSNNTVPASNSTTSSASTGSKNDSKTGPNKANNEPQDSRNYAIGGN